MPRDAAKSCTNDETHSAIESVVREVIAKVDEGLDVDYAAVVQTHPDLMPELARRLETFQAIQAAARQAREQRDPAMSSCRGSSTADDDILFLRETLANYEILERIHHGGQGVVYKAVQRSTKRTVALKVLLDGPLAQQRQRYRFEREVELISRLKHPHIVTIYDSGIVRGRQFFAMEFVDGLPIDDYVLLHRCSVKDTVRLAQLVCEAVSTAHQNGIIHRDLKPGNILVDSDGHPHVLDFGLAKDVTSWPDAGSRESISVEGRVMGTLPYLSPEQAAGLTDQVDVRSDIYALGVVIFELITGRFPYPVDADPQTVRNNILSCEPLGLRQALLMEDEGARVSEVSDDLARVVLKSLAKDRSQRYESAAALAADLGRFLTGEAVEAKAASRLYLLRKTIRRYRVHAAVAAALLAILVTSLVVVTIAWQRTERVARIAQAGLQMGSFLRLGAAHRDEGRVDRAIAMMEKVIEIGEYTGTSDPFVQRHLYDARHRLAEMYFETGRTEEAKPQVEAAVEIAQRLVDAEPDNLQWRRFLALSHELLSRTALSQADPEGALRALEHATAIYRDLLAADSQNASVKSDLAFTMGMQGKCYQRLRRFDESRQHYLAAYDIYQALLQSQPDVLDYQIELARTEGRLGVWHMAQRTEADDQAASEWLERSEKRLTGIRDSRGAQSRQAEINALLDPIHTNKELIRERSETHAAEQD